MAIIKPTGVAADINAGANTVSDASLVSIYNTGNGFSLVNTATGFNVWIAAGERIVVEKDNTDALDATGGSASVWATPIAYRG